MQKRPAKPCAHPGCTVLVRDGTSRCERHKIIDGSFSDSKRGSRHERGYGSKWDKLRAKILQRDAGLCCECRRKGRITAVGLEKYSAFVDHILPKAFGGTDDEDNLQTLCRSCHQAKTDREKIAGRFQHAMRSAK